MRPQSHPEATSKPGTPGLVRRAKTVIRLRVLACWPARGAPLAWYLRHSQEVVMEQEGTDEGNPPGAQGREVAISARRWRWSLAYSGRGGWSRVWTCATRSWS